MTVYSPKGKNTGAAVIVFPGGGYQILAIDLEAEANGDGDRDLAAVAKVSMRRPGLGLTIAGSR